VPPVTIDGYMTATRALLCALITCDLGFSADAPCQVTDDYLGQIEKSLTSGRRRLDPVRAQAFIAAVATLDGHACWGESVTAGLARMVEALDLADAAAPGTVALGQRCFDVAECDGGYCDLTACPGVCKTRHAAGDACNSHPECGAGALCVAVSADAARCVSPGPAGAVCDGERPCADPYACLGGVCADPAEVASGASCRDADDCGPDARCRDERCVSKSGIGGPCAAGVTVFPSPSPDCRGSLVCAGAEFDDDGLVTREGRCAVPSESREPCYPDAVEFVDGVPLNTSADGCFFGLVCDPATRRCALGPKPGEPCLAGRCEQGAYCDGMLCQALRMPGEQCLGPLECTGACDAGVCAPPPPNIACPAP
jgi:hypothetical protein